MKNSCFKKIILIIGMCMMAMMFCTKTYAASVIGSSKITKAIEGSTAQRHSWSYGHPSTNGIFSDPFSKLNNNVGIFCLWHENVPGRGRLWSKQTNGQISTVTTQCNNLRYVFGIQGGGYYKSRLAQKFLWHCESGATAGRGIYDIRSYFGLSGVRGPVADSNFMEAMMKANDYYNSKSSSIANPKKAMTKNGEITAYKNKKNEIVFGLFEMNAYSEAYNANCGTVNKTAQYSGYGSTNDKRAGVLVGIVDAELVLEQDGKTQTLKWSDKQFTFSYGKYGGQQGKKVNREYDYFPGPSSKFFVKVKEGIIDENKETKVTLKFTSIQTKFHEIPSAYIAHIFYQGSRWQPLLLCSGGITVNTWTSQTKFKIPAAAPVAKINTYISEVDGGREANDKGQAGKGYTYKGNEVQFKGVVSGSDRTIMKTSDESRAKWSENKKKNKKALIEKGDKVTFTVVIKNLTNYAIHVENVPLSGCIKGNEVTITDENGDKILGGYNKKKVNDKEIKLKLDQKISQNGSYKFKVTISSMYKETDRKADAYQYLKAELGTIKKESSLKKLDTAPSSSKDYFAYKNYYVTIDKYIEGTEKAVSDEVEDDGDAPEDNSDDDTPDDSSSSTGDVEEDDDAGYDIPAVEYSEEDRKTYLEGEDGTEDIDGITYQVIIGKDGQICCYRREDKYYIYNNVSEGGSGLCHLQVHLDEKTGKYYYILAEDLGEPVSESTNRVYLKWTGKGPTLGESKTFERYPGKTYAVIYEESTDNVACYMDTEDEKFYIIKEGSYATDISKAELIEVFIQNEGGKWFYQAPEQEIAKLYLETNDAGTIVYQSRIVDRYFHPVYKKGTTEIACYYHPGMWGKEGTTRYCYIKSPTTGYYDGIPIRWDSAEKAWYANMEEYVENDKITYLEINDAGNIVGRDTNKEGYREIWNQTVTKVVCYWKDGEYFYYDGRNYQPITVYNTGYNYYIAGFDIEEIENTVSQDKIYVKVDSSGNIIHETSPDDKYFYPVYDKEGKNIVCYYHPMGRYYVKSSTTGEYCGVYLHRDGNDWYFTEEDYEDISGKTFLEMDGSGNIVEGGIDGKGFATIKDMKGQENVCLRNKDDGKYYIYSSEEDYKEITITRDDYGVYVLDKDIANINNSSASDESDADEGKEGEDEDSTSSAEEKTDNRKMKENSTKKNDPVEVKVGDTVNYAMIVYNTVSVDKKGNNWKLGTSSTGKNPRKMGGYYAPKVVFVDIKDTLPQEYIKKVSSLEVKCRAAYSTGTTKETTYNVSVNSSGEFELKDVFVPAGGHTKITYSVVVENEASKDEPATNTAKITKLKNGNMAVVKASTSDLTRNTAKDKRKTSSDYFYSLPAKPPESEMGGLVYVAKVEHLEDYGPESVMGDTQLDVDAKTTIQSGNPPTKDTITTFEGVGNKVATEYGDKITYGIKVADHWEPPTGYGATVIPEYSKENENYDYAEVTVRVDLPADALTVEHNGETCYMVWINDGKGEKLYYIPTYNKPYLMIKYETEGGTVKTIEDREIKPRTPKYQVDKMTRYYKTETRYYENIDCDGHHPGSQDFVYSWCENNPYDCPNNHQIKTVKGITSFDLKDDTLKVSIINTNEKKDAQIPLSATITGIEYKHSYGYIWSWESTQCEGHNNFAGFTSSSYTHTKGYDSEGNPIPCFHWTKTGALTPFTSHTLQHQNCNDNSQTTRSFTRDMKEFNVQPYTGDPNYCKNHCGETIMLNGKYLGSACCVVTDYNVRVDEYIYEYNAEMLNYNNSHGFTNESKVHSPTEKYDTAEKALAVEKYETLKFQTKVTNKSRDGYEAENNTGRRK